VAKVVDFKAVRDRPDLDLVRDAVSDGHSPATPTQPYAAVPGRSQIAKPGPARVRASRCIDLCPEALSDWFPRVLVDSRRHSFSLTHRMLLGVA
jgi:hypothetical protein